MTQVIVEIPTMGIVSGLGRWGQEEAIFAAILDDAELMAFFTSPTIMSNDPVLPLICSNTSVTVNELIGPFGGHED